MCLVVPPLQGSGTTTRDAEYGARFVMEFGLLEADLSADSAILLDTFSEKLLIKRKTYLLRIMVPWNTHD